MHTSITVYIRIPYRFDKRSYVERMLSNPDKNYFLGTMLHLVVSRFSISVDKHCTWISLPYIGLMKTLMSGLTFNFVIYLITH